jgi:hypothetical protein
LGRSTLEYIGKTWEKVENLESEKPHIHGGSAVSKALHIDL